MSLQATYLKCQSCSSEVCWIRWVFKNATHLGPVACLFIMFQRQCDLSHLSKGFDLLPGDQIWPWGHWLNSLTSNPTHSSWIWRAHVCSSVVLSNSPFTRYLLTCQNNAGIQQHNKFSLFSLEEYSIRPSFTWKNVTKVCNQKKKIRSLQNVNHVWSFTHREIGFAQPNVSLV